MRIWIGSLRHIQLAEGADAMPCLPAGKRDARVHAAIPAALGRSLERISIRSNRKCAPASLVGRISLRKTGLHPRVKPEGRLFSGKCSNFAPMFAPHVLPGARDYEALYRSFRWQIPAHYNIG